MYLTGNMLLTATLLKPVCLPIRSVDMSYLRKTTRKEHASVTHTLPAAS